MANPEREPDMEIDLTALRRVWAARSAASDAVRQRVEPAGLRRPARDPDERAWLAERGETLFVEDEHAGAEARRYYARKYSRPTG